MVAPPRPAQTHTSAYMARSINRAKLIGPTGIVGLEENKGGRTRPSRRRKAIRASTLI